MMHHGMPLQHLSSNHMQRTSMGGSQCKALFCRNIMEACEAREHGSGLKQNHQVEGAIMQAKEWTRMFGRRNPMDHAVTNQQRSMECTGQNWSQKGQRGPQAGQPRSAGLPPSQPPWCSPSAGKLLIQFLVRVLEVVVQNHLRLSFHSEFVSSNKTS
jgi:hypothetical protein